MTGYVRLKEPALSGSLKDTGFCYTAVSSMSLENSSLSFLVLALHLENCR